MNMTKLKAIETLQNYLMRELSEKEIAQIMATNTDDPTSELLSNLSLTGTNAQVFDALKHLISSYFTESSHNWSKYLDELSKNDLNEVFINHLESIIYQLKKAVEVNSHKQDGYSDQTDEDINKYFETECESSTSDPENVSSTLDEYVSSTEELQTDKIGYYFDKLLEGKELEIAESDFDRIAEKFFSEAHEGCWSLSYDNGKVRMTCDK